VLVRCLGSVSRGSCAHPMGKRDCAWCCTGRKEPSGWVVGGGGRRADGARRRGAQTSNSHVLLLRCCRFGLRSHNSAGFDTQAFLVGRIYLSAAAGNLRNLIDSTKGHGVALEVGSQKKCWRKRELLKRASVVSRTERSLSGEDDTAPGTGRVLTTRGGPSLVSAQAVRPHPINQRVIVSVSCTSAAASWAKWIVLHDASAWP
jgi:hypothetical protein